MQALKALVIGMGILIFLGMAVIGVTLYKRATAPDMAPGDSAAAGALPSFGTAALTIPKGAHIQEVTGSGERLFIRLRQRDGNPRILVIDLRSGALLGTLEVSREP